MLIVESHTPPFSSQVRGGPCPPFFPRDPPLASRFTSVSLFYSRASCLRELTIMPPDPPPRKLHLNSALSFEFPSAPPRLTATFPFGRRNFSRCAILIEVAGEEDVFFSCSFSPIFSRVLEQPRPVPRRSASRSRVSRNFYLTRS